MTFFQSEEKNRCELMVSSGQQSPDETDGEQPHISSAMDYVFRLTLWRFH